MAEYTLADGTTIINAALSQEAEKNSVRIISGGIVSASGVVVDFAKGGCYTCKAPSGTFHVDVQSLGVGQSGRLHVVSPTPAPTVTFVGVDVWDAGNPPTFTAGKLTVVKLFNDGEVVSGGSSVCEAD